MSAEWFARLEGRFRPLIAQLPSSLAVRLYSQGRRSFLASFVNQRPASMESPPQLARTLWGLSFGSPLMNAAGMFKNGEGYEVVARQGAGAYLAGTTTARPRIGNKRCGVSQPFAPYPRSGAASNWLGLPNPGHRVVAERLKAIERRPNCPIGVSVAAAPEADLSEEQKLEGLVIGMRLYEEAGVDFLEMNESCPNTEEAVERGDSLGIDEALERRLAYVSEHFLAKRQRVLPVVVKFSCDTDMRQVPALVDRLLQHDFDGVNFGNTSTAYASLRPKIEVPEHPLYDYFTKTFEGGVSGRPLKSASLHLATQAVAHAMASGVRDFHVFRTGGVENSKDVIVSERADIAINQWYSGYFEAFARDGHDLYRKLYHQLELDDLGESGTNEWGLDTFEAVD